ncbi:MAG: hypothetical protein R3Y13_03095 [bacterium]
MINIDIKYNVIEEYKKDEKTIDLVKEINYKLYRIIMNLERI